MSRNAQRRHAKAVRRKNLLAERRQAETAGSGGSLAERVRRARSAPFHSCLVHKAMFEVGTGMVVLSRRSGARTLAVAGFLLDVHCLGVRDAFFREIDEEDLETLLEGVEPAAPLEAVDPSYARKLLRDAAAYARSIGLEPHADYAAVEAMFGDVAADAFDVHFRFGYDGKPLYAPGPTDSPTQVRRTVDRLRRKLGDDGFVFDEIGDDLDLDEDDPDVFDEIDDELEADDEDGYDPDVAPDPEQWLARDEQERTDLALRYHRRPGVSLPNERMHATFHVIIENQIAMGDELPVRRAVDRLMAEGLDRHEAIHAVGSVLAAHLNEALEDRHAPAFPKDAYNAAIERLTAESWRHDIGEDGDED